LQNLLIVAKKTTKITFKEKKKGVCLDDSCSIGPETMEKSQRGLGGGVTGEDCLFFRHSLANRKKKGTKNCHQK